MGESCPSCPDFCRRVVVLGATGAIGRELINILGDRQSCSPDDIRAYSTPASVGTSIDCSNDEVVARDIKEAEFFSNDTVFITTPSRMSGEKNLLSRYQQVLSSGSTIIDVCGSIPLHLFSDLGIDDIPYIVPELNIDKLHAKNAFRCPCSASIALSIVLGPIANTTTLSRIVVSTYQSASSQGRGGMDELYNQVSTLFGLATRCNEDENEVLEEHDTVGCIKGNKFPKQIAFNCFPQVGTFDGNGSTNEETRIIQETRSILNTPDLPMSITAAHVPVFNCCALSVNIQCKDAIDISNIRCILKDSCGIIVQDTPSKNIYPSNFALGGSDAVYVGRIRRDDSTPHTFNLWIVIDNLRKGSALNAVEIFEAIRNRKN